MADNYVEIRIKAADTAKPDLAELKAELDELGRKVETAKVDVDDEDGKLKLLDMNAKLAALDKKVASPRIDVAGAARAEAQIAAINAEMGKLDKKAQQNSSKGGLLGKLMFGSGGDSGSSGGGGGGLLGSFGSLPSGGIGGLLSNPYSLGAIAAGAQAALVEVTGLVSGFAAAGAGAGAFYLLAHPAINNLTGDMKKLSSAQQAVGYAQQTEQIDPTKAHLKALQAAQVKYKAIYQQMGQDAGPAAAGMLKLHDTYVKLSNAFQPQVFKVLNDGLRIANTLLPTITPFANAFANALDGLLKKVAGFAQSKGFKDWLAQFQKLTGPSLTAIGTGVGHVAIAFGKLLTIMSAKDVVNSINIAFTVLAKTITGIGLVVKFAMMQWDFLTTAVDRGRAAIKASLSWFGGLGGMFSRWWGAAVSAASAQIGRLLSLAASIRGRILGAVGNLGGLLYSAGQNVLLGLLHGIESMVGSIVSAAANVGSSILGSIKGALGLGSPSRITRQHGVWLAQGLIEGMDSMHGSLGAAAGRMAGGAVPGRYGTGTGGAGGAGGTVKVQLEFVGGDDMLLRGLRNAIRVRGGNVQQVLGH